ncbi:2-succinylbenzoate--CoA ligase [Hypsizygus marmoreus]|uniref:2-succinylbenzoate--CoA ligase n=1 Tax=Hypsizygus marmoreus TaxID=39966 RepID=A0A369JK56_HYPMA|nr:2-succinylbenzoate--CoA ligase [Hypsizygus marmoreus]
MSKWTPQRTLDETEAILCGPGNLHETEVRLVDGRLQRVYKNLWPSLRIFWLWASKEHAKATYIVFESQRLTFGQAFQRSLKAACIYKTLYGIKKGDRVAICARNYPDHMVAFWACHLIGAISVQVNAWLPLDALHYCLAHTGSKLVILDSERADRLEPSVDKLVTDAGTNGFLVLEAHEGKGQWKGMQSWNTVLDNFHGETTDILNETEILPEDDATILFTSGTTGLPKGVLSTNRMYLTNVLNVLVASRRALLRRGENILPKPAEAQKGILISVPLFHVTGSTSLTMLATMAGMKVVFLRKWQPEEAARLIKAENISVAGGVPSMVADLTESSLAGFPMESLMFGGAPAPEFLAVRAGRVFPDAVMSQGYGLTETNSVAVGVAGHDYTSRPTTCGLPTPINDIMIIDGDKAVSTGEVGEVWLRGPNVMKCYWRDPAATEQALTKDGWFKSGDLGYLDKEGFLYIKDRIKDIILRGGENVDSVSVENALYADERVMEAAAVGVPHPRLGELVTAVVSVKPAFSGQVTEASLISMVSKSLPKFAIPVMIIVQDEPLERTQSGKILKGGLRKLARDAWEKRQKDSKVQSKL